MGRFQPHQKAGVNIMGGEAALSTNPEKDQIENRKINVQNARGRVNR